MPTPSLQSKDGLQLRPQGQLQRKARLQRQGNALAVRHPSPARPMKTGRWTDEPLSTGHTMAPLAWRVNHPHRLSPAHGSVKDLFNGCHPVPQARDISIIVIRGDRQSQPSVSLNQRKGCSCGSKTNIWGYEHTVAVTCPRARACASDKHPAWGAPLAQEEWGPGHCLRTPKGVRGSFGPWQPPTDPLKSPTSQNFPSAKK